MRRVLLRELNRIRQVRNGIAFQDMNTRRFSRVYVNVEHKFIYNRIPKNANSTISTYLYSLNGGAEIDKSERAREEAKGSLPYLDRVNVRDDLREYTSLLVLREPLDRCRSAFLDKFREGSGYRKKFGDFDISPQGFSRFVKWLANGGLQKDPHWMPQIELLAFPIEFYTDIIGVDCINDKLPGIFASVGMDSEAFFSHKNASIGLMHSTKEKSKAAEFWNDETLKIAQKLYKKDLDAFEKYCG